MIIVGYDASRHNWFRHKDGPVPEKDVPSQNIVLMGKKIIFSSTSSSICHQFEILQFSVYYWLIVLC